jgi:hypothetical protein
VEDALLEREAAQEARQGVEGELEPGQVVLGVVLVVLQEVVP